MDEVSLRVLSEAQSVIRYSSYDISLSEATDMQMRVNPQTDKHYAYVHANHIDEDYKVTASALNVRTGPDTSNDRVGSLSNGTEVNVISEVNGWYQIEYSSGSWVSAAREDVEYYLNPTNFLDDERQRFQFLDLSRTSNASIEVLNNHLGGKGILDGKAQAFIEASRTHGVNDVYLISHAILETGHGSSDLATGIEVGKDKDGNLKLVDDDNRGSLIEIETTYNMYGIGAVDRDPKREGAFEAYRRGWYTPEESIVGGAQFIGDDYIRVGQNTLYKMRWNPDAMDSSGRATHQYATDIGWAYKQVGSMYNLYQELGIDIINLDVPTYSD
ncbi:hypothetical protein GCM10008935_26440 [Alkalibacillus silvisoli]|uniref:SH3b domain-containing protein n=2 Tax=Alkalibacillus silvisoli TaxID=392823 RepID=A0ABN1A7A2_9BACI